MKKIFCLLLFFCYVTIVKAEELPKLYLEGNISNMTTKKDERQISFKYVDNSNKYTGYANIKIQGTSSIAYAKKNYTIKLYEDKNLSQKLKLDLGWGEQNKYCLKANWIDKTHARNIVAARIASNIQAKYNLFNDTPNHGLIDGYPIEIYSNNKFLGLYTLNIPKDAWMFNMDEDNPNHLVFVGDAWTSSVFFQGLASWDGSWELEVGKANDETLAKLNRLIAFVKDSSDEEFKENINDYLNLNALINYYVISQYFYLPDNMGKNMLLVTYDGQVWYPSLYDLDTSFGTSFNGQELYNYYNLVLNGLNHNLFQKLINNFGQEIADRYFTLQKEFLNVDYIMQEFNNFENKIPTETFAKEQERWHNIPGYDLDQVKEFMQLRTPEIDKYMTSLYPNGEKPEEIVDTLAPKEKEETKNKTTAKENKNDNNKLLISLTSLSFLLGLFIVAIRKRKQF